MKVDWHCDSCGFDFREAVDVAACPQCGSQELVRREQEDATLPTQSESARTIDGCRVERCLGRGGMGEVWLGYESFADRRVAIKTIRPEFTADEQIQQRFRNEVRACAKIRSNHVVQLFASGELPEGGFFMRMEFVDGESLADARVRHAGGKVPLRDALQWVRDAARGLYDAEQVGIVHRDIKPANLLRDKNDRVLVADFGIAFLTDAATRLTQDNSVPGTALYMAPELFDGESASVQSDVYSLGATLFQLLSGRPPSDGQTIGEIYHHKREHATLSLRREGVAVVAADESRVRQVDELLADMTARQAARRPSSFADVVARLDALLADDSATAPAHPAATSPRQLRRAWFVGGIAVAAIAVVVVLATRNNGDGAQPGEQRAVVQADGGDDRSESPQQPTKPAPGKAAPPVAPQGEAGAVPQPGSAQSSAPGSEQNVQPEARPAEQPGVPADQPAARSPAQLPQPSPHVEWLAKWCRHDPDVERADGYDLPRTVTHSRRGVSLHLVQMADGFAYVDVEEVSWRQWADSGRSRPDDFRADAADLPVRGIDGDAAAAFAAEFDLQLPTFAQWRRTAYGDDRELPWGSGAVRMACNKIARTGGGSRSDQTTGGVLEPTDSDFESCREPFRMLVGNVREILRAEGEGGFAVVGVGFASALRTARFARDRVRAYPLRAAAVDVGFRCLRVVPVAVAAAARLR